MVASSSLFMRVPFDWPVLVAGRFDVYGAGRVPIRLMTERPANLGGWWSG